MNVRLQTDNCKPSYQQFTYMRFDHCIEEDNTFYMKNAETCQAIFNTKFVTNTDRERDTILQDKFKAYTPD